VDGAQLALRTGAIVVAVQYRLGPLGFFQSDATKAGGMASNVPDPSPAPRAATPHHSNPRGSRRKGESKGTNERGNP
jgi:hypothetical protein